MREIKFRVWDKETERMNYSFEPDEEHQGKREYYPFCFGIGFSYWGKSWLSPLMQFTGLLDKNGKEIYEGDIVKIVEDKNKKTANEPHQFKYGDIAKVEWSDTNLAYYLVNEELEDIEVQMDYYGAWSGWNWLEIIGNIYENPELIK